jgi:hypothetical protein
VVRHSVQRTASIQKAIWTEPTDTVAVAMVLDLDLIDEGREEILCVLDGDAVIDEL